MMTTKKSSRFNAYGFLKTDQAKTEKPKETVGYAVGKSALGLILVATCRYGIVAVLRGKTRAELVQALSVHCPDDVIVKAEWDAERALDEVLKLIDRPAYHLTYPVHMQGTDFQRKVWQAVRDVPPGKTATYSEIAQTIQAPRAMRAVGSSCTRSKLFFVVPCHRVVRNDYTIPDKQTPQHQLNSRDRLLLRETL